MRYSVIILSVLANFVKFTCANAAAGAALLQTLQIDYDVARNREITNEQIATLSNIAKNFVNEQGDRHNLDREELTKELAWNAFPYGTNVMVVKLDNARLTYEEGNTKVGTFKVSTACHCFLYCQTCWFKVFYAPQGVKFGVFNNGDGGYINWAFSGKFNRRGKTVHFY